MEVKVINKQKFLAELGRLLTFMYEEDRQTALAMYSKMFDDAVDEQALLQFLVSPTRQAVVLARSYDAKERKLQVHTQTREEEPDYSDYDGQFPPFILAIDDLQQDAAARGIFAPLEEQPAVDEDQFSLFDDVASQEAPAQESAPASAPQVISPAPPAYQESEAPLPEDDNAPAKDSVSEFADAVDAFLADFAIADGELVPNRNDRPEPPAEEPDGPVFDDQPFQLDRLPGQENISPPEPSRDGGEQLSLEPAPMPEEEELPQAEEEEEQIATVRKARVFPLILYIIVSIPITLLGVALLLIPTLLWLSLAVTFVSAGVLVLTAAFAGFTIFADLMIILGLAVILLAIGLLFTWLFIWFIGGAIAGLIRGVCHLGGKWCYKEVAVR